MPEPTQPHSPVIYTYLKRYQENPGSRVFAPLAEAYRKAGLVEEAIEIAREGLELHPTFVGGRVALARALFDKREYEQVCEILSSVIRDVPDNLVAQKLYAESSLMLGNIADALSSYKMYLYFHPGDEELAKIVQELEASAYERGALVLKKPSPQTGAAQWVRKVEFLQNLLLRVQAYRRQKAENC